MPCPAPGLGATMTFDGNRRHRRSIRLSGFDYAQPGAYFVTICTHDRRPLLGDVVDGEVRLSRLGQAVRQCWNEIPDHFPHVQQDAFIVMPNHFHGLCAIDVSRMGGTACRAPHTTTRERFGAPVSGSLPTIVRSFKSASTRRINKIRDTPGALVWQRNYYEHVIRGDDELNLARQYVLDNPAKWSEDVDNPAKMR